jgi:hypothetical protein
MNETPIPGTNQLKLLAAKLKDNHGFMAWILSTYQQKEYIDDDHLMAQLKTNPEMFVRLALCKCPDSNSSIFASQVREIATYTNIDPEILANVIRQVESLDIFLRLPNRGEQSTKVARNIPSGFLAAARDKTDGEETETGKSDSELNNETGGDDVAG